MLIIYSVILFVISVISVTLTAEYATDELDMIIFLISYSKLIRFDVLLVQNTETVSYDSGRLKL